MKKKQLKLRDEVGDAMHYFRVMGYIDELGRDKKHYTNVLIDFATDSIRTNARLRLEIAKAKLEIFKLTKK